jgi:hypothetical protein
MTDRGDSSVESFNADEPVVRAVRTLQIMVGGMIFSAVFFLLVALVTFGKQGNTRLAADATAGAQTILTYDHVPVGTRVVIGAGTTSEEVKVVGQTEKIEGVEQLKLRLDSALAADHTKDEAIRRYQPGRQPAIAYILLACTAGPLAAWAVVPTAMTRNARKRLARTPEHDRNERQDTVALALAFQTRTLVAAALIETAVFLNVLAYLLAQVPLSAVVAVGLIVLLGCHFPTHGRAAHWMETQKTLMQPGR